MIRYLIFLICLLSTGVLQGQTTISGTVTDKKGNPIAGANVYIENTYDGSSSDPEGKFQFVTQAKGIQNLIVSFISYAPYQLKQEVASMQNLVIQLRESVNSLDAVMVTAGTFSAGDNSKLTALKPLDVVTTAGAAGNYIAAFQTLPGTSTVAESGELYIRGGSSTESQTFIDGLRVFKPYTTTASNIPSRGRYSPMLFKGMTFNTGGYSAEYGQALSGILSLETEDFPISGETNISLMSVGAGLGQTIKGKTDALSINTSYTNLKPYYKLVPNRYKWEKFPQILSGESVYRHQFEKGILKIYSGFDYSRFHVLQEDIDYSDPVSYNTQDKNLYLNTSYKGQISDSWLLFGGTSYSLNKTEEKVFSQNINTDEHSSHFKIRLKNLPTETLKFSMGAEYFITKLDENIYLQEPVSQKDYRFTHQLGAVFTEASIYFSKNTAGTFGLRGEYSDYTDNYRIAPRISIAQKTSKNGQISLAWGQFYQLPQNEYLKYTKQLGDENSQQYILNYQYNKKQQFLRFELYYKKYNNLVKYEFTDESLPVNYDNTGSGEAMGLDLYWKDASTVKNLKYWISYSYLDTERNYQDFPEKAQPNFTNKHNLSVVGKYWLPSLQSQIGLSYSFASGRPYHDPNQTDFMQRKTSSYNNLSLNWSWLITQQKILYCSVSNVLGFDNTLGYDYAQQTNANGMFDRMEIKPYTKRFFFVGLFITINKNKKSNQLDNL